MSSFYFWHWRIGVLMRLNKGEKDDYCIINILSCALSASVLPTIKNKYSVEEVYVYYDCHYENKGMKIKDK